MMSKLVGLWLLSLVLVACAAAIVTAQVTRTPPRVITGANLGFRIDGVDMKGNPVGTIVVRMNGEWIAVGDRLKASPALSSFR
jgi:hypothetical protein